MTSASRHDVDGIAYAFARVNSAALRSLYRPEIAEEHGLRTVSVKSALALLTASPVAVLNRVVNLGVFEPATPAQVDEIAALYARAHLPFTVQLSPTAGPPELPTWLSERGLRTADEWTVLARSPGPGAEVAGLHVGRVGPEEASKYARLYESAFALPFGQGNIAASTIGQPGWYHYAAQDERRAFAVAAMFVHEGAALFAGSGTLGAENGRGAQTALIARRLADAAAKGCDLALVESSERLGDETPVPLRNVMRAGFRVAFYQRTFVYAEGFRKRLDPTTGRWV